MTTEVMRAPPERREPELKEGALSARLNWSSIFGGTVAALGVWVLLYALGLALGLSAMDPADPGSAQGAGIFTGIWGLVTPLIALFVGGFIAARSAGVASRDGGVFHGVVVWGLTTLAGAYLVATLLGTVVGGAVNTGKAALEAAGGAASSAAQSAGSGGIQGVAQTFGLDANDALAPVNQRLQAEGKPAITADQLQAAVKDVVNTAVRQGELDRNLLVSSIAQNTALSRQDSEEIASRIEAQFAQTRQQASAALGDVREGVQTGALEAADATGKAFWGVFGALLLGLVSSVVGSAMGGKKRRGAVEAGAVPMTGPIVGRREVYP